jgi:ribulose-phosphate 3-epimerase
MAGTARKLHIPAIAPSILTADFGRLHDEIQEAESAGVDMIHLDVMDGHFVPNISFGPLVVSAIWESTNLPLDVHLMIESPERYIDAFVDAGASIISIHAEATAHPHRALQQIKDGQIDAGIAINPATPLSAVREVLPVVDLVLLMTVNPGFGGQSFIPESVDRIRRLHELLVELGHQDVRIEVDGGLKEETINQAREAGAEIFVTGSSVFNDRESVADAVARLRSALGS